MPNSTDIIMAENAYELIVKLSGGVPYDSRALALWTKKHLTTLDDQLRHAGWGEVTPYDLIRHASYVLEEDYEHMENTYIFAPI